MRPLALLLKGGPEAEAGFFLTKRCFFLRGFKKGFFKPSGLQFPGFPDGFGVEGFRFQGLGV